MAHPLVRKWQISPTLRRMAAAILVAVMVAAVQAKTPPIVVHVRSIAATSATTSSTAITTSRTTTSTGRSYDSLVDCVADLRNADLNGDELVSDTEYIALVNSVVKTYGYCYPLAIGIVEQFTEASCLCQDYYANLNATQQALVPTCTCSGVPGNIALPNTIYPAEYTRRICEGLQLLLDTTVCPPTVAPVAALPTAAGGSATPTPSTSTTTTNAPAIPEETNNNNDIDMVNSDADKGGNGVGIALGILIPLLLVTLGIYYRRYHVNDRAILGKQTEDSTDNNHADNCANCTVLVAKGRCFRRSSGFSARLPARDREVPDRLLCGLANAGIR